MGLEELRAKINSIDDELKKLLEKRQACAGEIATEKLATNDEVFKPAREREIRERLYRKDPAIAAIFPRIIAESRKVQYKLRLENEENPVWPKGGYKGKVTVFLKCDPAGETALSVPDLLALLGSFSLKPEELHIAGDAVTFMFRAEEADENNLRLLFYMLYKETLEFKIGGKNE